MRLILPILLAIIGVAAGGAVGFMYKSAQLEKKAMEAAENETDADGAASMDEAEPAEEMDASRAAAEDSEYLPLSRKLIVPFVRGNGRKAYVAVDVTLEIGPGETEFATAHEPKIIDAFLRTLINFAATGAFEDPSQASFTLDELNEELFKAAKSVLGERVRSVLIANLLTQDA